MQVKVEGLIALESMGVNVLHRVSHMIRGLISLLPKRVNRLNQVGHRIILQTLFVPQNFIALTQTAISSMEVNFRAIELALQ